MSSLSLNLEQTVPDTLSVHLRHPFWVESMKALLAPISDLNARLEALEEEIKEIMSYNGQTIVLERMLNLIYYQSWSNNSPNPIYIVSQEILDDIYFFNEEENRPVFFSEESEDRPIFIYNEEALATSAESFIVYVPSTLVFDPAQMRGLIQRYKLAGKTFQIITYP